MDAPVSIKTYHFTRDELRAAFLSWEEDDRAGKCSDYNANKQRPIGEIADEATNTLIERLERQRPVG